MKDALLGQPDLPLYGLLPLLLQATTLATLALLVRYGWLLGRQLEGGNIPATRWLGWALAVLCSAVVFWYLPTVTSVMSARS